MRKTLEKVFDTHAYEPGKAGRCLCGEWFTWHRNGKPLKKTVLEQWREHYIEAAMEAFEAQADDVPASPTPTWPPRRRPEPTPLRESFTIGERISATYGNRVFQATVTNISQSGNHLTIVKDDKVIITLHRNYARKIDTRHQRSED